MVLQALIAPIPAFLLAFANGIAFGAIWGGLLTFGSALLAASLSFLIGRGLGRNVVETLVGRAGLTAADAWFMRYGPWAVLIARLIPISSFDLISYAAGLSKMRFRWFLAATAVGIAPTTFLYAFLGEPSTQRPIWSHIERQGDNGVALLLPNGTHCLYKELEKMMQQPNLTVYGALWCGDCRRAKRFLDEHGVDYAWINIDQDATAAAEVVRLNRGMRSIPTIVFADGSTLVEPSNTELGRKLGLG